MNEICSQYSITVKLLQYLHHGGESYWKCIISFVRQAFGYLFLRGVGLMHTCNQQNIDNAPLIHSFSEPRNLFLRLQGPEPIPGFRVQGRHEL